MLTDAHARVTLSRGEKSTSSMNPKVCKHSVISFTYEHLRHYKSEIRLLSMYFHTELQFNVFGSILVVLAEHKPIEGAATYNNSTGIKLITASGRRNLPQCVDSKIHHNNLINDILPKIQVDDIDICCCEACCSVRNVCVYR